MAKKKGKKGKSRGKKTGINTAKLIGMGVAVFADKKFLDEQLAKYITDPKMRAAAKIVIGEYAPKQDFVRNIVKDQATLDGGGDALTVLGISELFTAMNISGFGENDESELAVAIEGIDDIDTDDMDEDVLGEDDDIDTVNEDVLGDDDDIDTVNDDDDDED